LAACGELASEKRSSCGSGDGRPRLDPIEFSFAAFDSLATGPRSRRSSGTRQSSIARRPAPEGPKHRAAAGPGPRERI